MTDTFKIKRTITVEMLGDAATREDLTNYVELLTDALDDAKVEGGSHEAGTVDDHHTSAPIFGDEWDYSVEIWACDEDHALELIKAIEDKVLGSF